MSDPVRIFISYSRKDLAHLEALETHLSNLKRQNRIAVWTDQKLRPSTEWEPDLLSQLRSAEIVLLLVTPDLMASDFVHDVELKETLERHKDGAVKVVPVLVRPTDFEGHVLARFQGLPRNFKPISEWSGRDQAWVEVVKGVRELVEILRPNHADKDDKTSHAPAPASTGAHTATKAPAALEKAKEPEKSPTLTLLHISDLHFGQARDQGRVHFDQLKVVGELLKDARAMRDTLGSPDAILVTGDIAFSAHPDQYRQADEWLREVAHAVGVSPEKVWLVPGNHDVDRAQATKPLNRKLAHAALRSDPSGLNDCLLKEHVEELASSLWPKLQPYADFARPWAAPTLSAQAPFWRQTLQTGLGEVLLVGLNSCLLSLDGTDAKTNLALSQAQLHTLLEKIPEKSLTLALMHHPPEWLSDGEELLKELQKGPHLLFSGHVHAAGGGVLHGLGQNARLRFDAGASHAAPDEPGRHEYAWIQLRRDGLDWYPRVYSTHKSAFKADGERLEDGTIVQVLEKTALPKKLQAWLTPVPPPIPTRTPAPAPSNPPAPAPADPLEPARDLLSAQTWEKALAYFLLKHSHIELQGIRRTDGAVRLPLEQVYVELRAEQTGESHRHLHLHPSKDTVPERMEGLDVKTSLHEALARSRRAIFVGDPGSGKTTLLRFVARILAEGALTPGQHTQRARDLLKLTPSQPIPFPVFTTLADLDRWLEVREVGLSQVTGKLTQGFLCSVLESAGLTLTVSELQTVIEAGQLLVLLDGFDEIPGHRERQRAARAVAELLACCPSLRVLMTSRTRAFETDVQTVLSQLEPWRLQPMSPDELLRFLRVWYGAVHAPDTAQGEKVARELFDEIQQHPEVKLMATTPNILTLIAILKHNQARLPKRRVELYREVIDLFLELKDIAKGLEDVWEAELGIRFDLSEKRQLLTALALEMHEGGEAGRTVPMKVPVMCFAKQLLETRKVPEERLALAKAEKLLDVLELRSGLLRKEGYGVQFLHLGLQEFAAALALSQERNDLALWQRLVPRVSDDWWNEVIRLLIAIQENQSGPLLTRLADAGQGISPNWKQAGRGIALALGGLNDLPTIHVKGEVRDQVMGKLTLLTGRDTKVPVKDRVEALLALGRVGDPRLGLEKPENWIWIPPGEFMMGDNKGDSDEKPAHKVTFSSGFHMSRFPVTNHDFKAFVEAGGYSKQEWWSDQGWHWRMLKGEAFEDYFQRLRKRFTGIEDTENWRANVRPGDLPRFFEDPRWNAPNQPVVGVSWYESEAFCRWMNAHRRQLPSTFRNGERPGVIRLPTEAEWEYAARGKDGRKYPWGKEELSPERANYDKTGLQQTSPVGAFPLGATPEGLLDMAGNAWEWTEDDWHPNYTNAPSDGRAWTEVRRVNDESALRVARGGSWGTDPGWLRSSLRVRFGAGWRGGLQGFRLVSVPSLA